MADLYFRVDVGDLADAVEDIKTLYGDGAGLPRHLRRRVKRLWRRPGPDIVSLGPVRRGVAVAVCGPELAAVLAELRIHRNRCNISGDLP